MNNLMFTGKIVKIGKIEEGTTKAGKDWASVKILVQEEKDQYPQACLFKYFKTGEYSQYVTGINNNFKAGDNVTVEFNLGTSEYNGKLYNEINAWKITSLEEATEEAVPDGEEDSDLPF